MLHLLSLPLIILSIHPTTATLFDDFCSQSNGTTAVSCYSYANQIGITTRNGTDPRLIMWMFNITGDGLILTNATRVGHNSWFIVEVPTINTTYMFNTGHSGSIMTIYENDTMFYLLTYEFFNNLNIYGVNGIVFVPDIPDSDGVLLTVFAGRLFNASVSDRGVKQSGLDRRFTYFNWTQTNTTGFDGIRCGFFDQRNIYFVDDVMLKRYYFGAERLEETGRTFLDYFGCYNQSTRPTEGVSVGTGGDSSDETRIEDEGNGPIFAAVFWVVLVCIVLAMAVSYQLFWKKDSKFDGENRDQKVGQKVSK